MFASRPIVVTTLRKTVRVLVMDKLPPAVNRQGNHSGISGQKTSGLRAGVAPMRR
jgi:hypothetical protein